MVGADARSIIVDIRGLGKKTDTESDPHSMDMVLCQS